jgi:hypothetical protein
MATVANTILTEEQRKNPTSAIGGANVPELSQLYAPITMPVADYIPTATDLGTPSTSGGSTGYTPMPTTTGITIPTSSTGGATGYTPMPTTTATVTPTATTPTLSVYDSQLSADDQARIAAYKQAYAAAQAAGDTAGMTSAHSAAEAIRATSGQYSGGSDGSQYIGIGGAPTYTAPTLPSATSQESYINSLYAAQQEAALQALKTAYDANINTINATKEQIPLEYQTARNSAASQSALGKQAWNEYAAAAGLASGASAQANLAQNNVLQGNLSNISQAESTALAELELQRTQIMTGYQNAIAQAIADGNLEKARALYDEAVRVDESLVQTALNQAQLGIAQYESQANAYNTNTANNQYLAELIAGTTGNYSRFGSLGATSDEIASMNAAYQAALAAQAAAGGGGYSGGGGTGGGGASAEYTPSYDYNSLSYPHTKSMIQNMINNNRDSEYISKYLIASYNRGDITAEQLEELAAMAGIN